MNKKILFTLLAFSSGVSLAASQDTFPPKEVSTVGFYASSAVTDGQINQQSDNSSLKNSFTTTSTVSPNGVVSLPIVIANCKEVNGFCEVYSKTTISGPKGEKNIVLFDGKIWGAGVNPGTIYLAKNAVVWGPNVEQANGVYKFTTLVTDKNTGNKVTLTNQVTYSK